MRLRVHGPHGHVGGPSEVKEAEKAVEILMTAAEPLKPEAGLPRLPWLPWGSWDVGFQRGQGTWDCLEERRLQVAFCEGNWLHVV